jgi:hypothetical protein
MATNDKEIARRTTVALAAIKHATEDPDSVALFASHHLEELDPAYWQQHTGTSQPSRERVLELLELRKHWGGKGLDVFDFTLPGKVTDYVVSVRFDDDGEVEAISMES